MDAKLRLDQVEPLGFGKQALSWIWVFVGSQLFVLSMVWIGTQDYRLAFLVAGLAAFPMGGYQAYRTFNDGWSVVICLIVQAAMFLLAARMRLRMS